MNIFFLLLLFYLFIFLVYIFCAVFVIAHSAVDAAYLNKELNWIK
jgi:hypothetical protein